MSRFKISALLGILLAGSMLVAEEKAPQRVLEQFELKKDNEISCVAVILDHERFFQITVNTGDFPSSRLRILFQRKAEPVAGIIFRESTETAPGTTVARIVLTDADVKNWEFQIKESKEIPGQKGHYTSIKEHKWPLLELLDEAVAKGVKKSFPLNNGSPE